MSARERRGDGPLAPAREAAPPDPRRDWREAAFLALDLETTGLEPARHEIVAIGWVPLQGASASLAGARRRLVRPENGVTPESAVVHRLTDDALAGAAPLAEALPELLEALAGRVLVAHAAAIERGFLAAACRRLYGTVPPLPTVDTARLAARLERRRTGAATAGLRLGAARARYGLPPWRAHDALADALACAELFLAQAEELAAGGPLPLRRLLWRPR